MFADILSKLGFGSNPSLQFRGSFGIITIDSSIWRPDMLAFKPKKSVTEGQLATRRLFAFVCAATLFVASMLLPAFGETIYVSPTGDDDADGLSTNTPMKTLRAAWGKKTKDVVLMPGTYQHNLSEGTLVTSSNGSGGKLRGYSDNPRDAVIDFGGTSGCILSLDSTHAFWMSNVTCTNAAVAGTILITFGSTANQPVRAVVSNCVFTCNSLTASSSLSAGVMYIGSKVLVTDCLFEGNESVRWSAAITTRCGGRIEKCTFRGNKGTSTSSAFATVYSYASSGSGWRDTYDTTWVKECEFYDNEFDLYSGATCTYNVPVVENCVFSNNYMRSVGSTSAAGAGACHFNAAADAMYRENDGKTVVRGCKFYNNRCRPKYSGSSALFFYSCGGLVTNCLFAGNEVTKSELGSSSGGAVAANESTNNTVTVADCTFVGNRAEQFGGAICNVVDVQNCTIVSNTAGTGGGLYYGAGAVRLHNLPVRVRNCLIEGNAATNVSGGCGGGLSLASNCAVTNMLIDSCVIVGNSAAAKDTLYGYAGGGGIFAFANNAGYPGLTVRNTLVASNRLTTAEGMSSGSGMTVFVKNGGRMIVENCTVTANDSAVSNGYLGAVYVWTSGTFFTNTVIAGNTIYGTEANCKPISTAYGDYSVPASNMTQVVLNPKISPQHSVPADRVWNGVDPKFKAGTFVPSRSSPCRDAGVLLDWMDGSYDLKRDADGLPFCERVVGAAPDIGCYEFMPKLGLKVMVW